MGKKKKKDKEPTEESGWWMVILIGFIVLMCWVATILGCFE